MNILILDYVPLVVATLATVYSAFQMLRWAERGKLRWIVYGLIACLSVLGATVAKIQVEALQMHDSQQSQVLSVDCTTDYECEQLELAQGEESE